MQKRKNGETTIFHLILAWAVLFGPIIGAMIQPHAKAQALQPTPALTTLAPVVLIEDTPQPDFMAWFWDDLTSQGFTFAVKNALGMGRNEDGWIEYWAMLNLGMTREQSEALTRGLYRALYGEPDPRPFEASSTTL